MIKTQQVEHTIYPSHNIPQKKKTGKWCQQHAMAFYNEFTRNGYNILYNKREQYEIIRKYALGLQDVEQYKRRLDMENLDETYVNLDWTPIPVWPKFRDIILSRLRDRGYKVTATPIDPLSLDRERQYRYEQLAKIALKDTLDFVKMGTGVSDEVFAASTEDVNTEVPYQAPRDMGELELHMQLNYKNRLALFAEIGIDVVLYQNDWKEIAEQIRADLVDLGVASTKDYIDAHGKIRVRRCDPANMLVSYSTRQDFRFADKVGEIVPMTLQELRLCAGSQFTEAQYQEISETAAASHRGGLIGIKDGYNLPGDSGTVYVMDYEFMSDDLFVTEEKTHDSGDTHKYIKDDTYEPKEQGKSKVKRTPYQNLYRSKWIIGTEYSFDNGLARDMKRNRSNYAEAYPSFHVYAINMISMENKSTGERVIPYVDALQLTSLKLQNALARAKNKGLAIEMGSLSGVMKGDSGETFKPLEVITIYEQTGNLLYNRVDMNGDYANGMPITELENGMAADVIRFVEIYNYYLDQIRIVTGISEVADASAPTPGQLNGTTQATLEATNKALGALYAADQVLLENTAKSVLMHFQSKHSNYQGQNFYVNSLGQAALALIEENSDFTYAEFGLKVEQLPDEREQQQLEMDIQASLNKRDTTGTGGIELEDAMAVRRVAKSNIKLAEQYLIFKRRQRLEDDMAKAEQQSQMNAEQQAAAAQQANEQQQQLLQLEADMEIMKARELSAIRIEEAAALSQIKREEMILQGQIGAEHIDLKGDIEVEKMDKQILMYDTRMDHATENKMDGTDKTPKLGGAKKKSAKKN